MKFSEFLLENDIKKEKAEIQHLSLKGFGHATDAQGNNYEWIDSSKTWAQIINKLEKNQIRKILDRAGFSESKPKQFVLDRHENAEKGFEFKKISATTSNVAKLRNLPEKGRKYYLHGTGIHYIIGWAHN